MDQTTHEVRISNWKSIIEQCQSRPKGQTTKQWLKDNGISDKQYYYWLRKLRKLAYNESHSEETSFPPAAVMQTSPIPFAEIPAQDILTPGSEPAVTIKTKKSLIQISSSVSETLMIELVKAVSHAL